MTTEQELFVFINQDMTNALFDWLCPLLRNKNTWIPFYVLAAFWLVKKNWAFGLRIIVAAALCILVSDQLSNFIKHTVQRPRPCAVMDVRLLVSHCSQSFSFTSSHAANHFALAVLLSLVLFRQQKIYVFLLLLWASSIAFAQVYVGLHYVSDVLAGALLGTLVGTVAYFTFEKMNHQFSHRSHHEF